MKFLDDIFDIYHFMIQALRRLVALILMAAALFGMGCGASATKAGKAPLGVSPQVASTADAIGANLFVSKDRERKAQAFSATGIRNYFISDSLWAILDELQSKPRQESSATPANGVNVAANATAESPVANKQKSAEAVRERQLRIQASYHLVEARKGLEKSVQLHPFVPETRHHLALTYKLLAQRFPQEKTRYDEAIRQWGELAHVVPGESVFFYNLGSTHFAKRQWSQAGANFKRAEELLLASAEVNDARLQNLALPAALDTSSLFYAIYYQGQCAIKLREADSALAHLGRAKTLTDDPNFVRIIELDVKWINWDQGNIWGSELRDRADSLAAAGNYAEAGKLYNDLTNKILNTKRAKDDIAWDFATIEFTRLNRRASAVARLDEVMKTIPKNEEGAPLDTTYNRPFDNYGAMCHFLGADTMRIDRRVAFDYVARAAAIQWKERGKSYLLLAELARSNPELSVSNAEKAVPLAQQLNTEEVKNLYKLLIDGYRRQRKMDKAKEYFDKLNAMP